jgi:cysteinyl-tRNA synthetase
MKKYFLFTMSLLAIFISSCGDEDEADTSDNGNNNVDYKQEMRDFVTGISTYSKDVQPGFIVIPQNGIELVSGTGEEEGQAHNAYNEAIDGNGQEDFFYGYNNDDKATPANERQYLQEFLDLSKNTGNTILVTDYCSTPSKMDDSYSQNHANGYVSFAADHRELDNIPDYPTAIYAENANEIDSLSEIKNFLYLINPDRFSSKSGFISAVNATNYDLLIMDLFFDETEFTNAEIDQLKSKANGGKRLVVCYMSVGEAEDYRYYWDSDWKKGDPEWLDKENPDWGGNYKVKYWMTEWQNIIYGNDDSYLKKILDAHFDGVYLDIIDAFEYYE